MLGTLAQFVRQIRQPALAMLAVAAMALPVLSTSAAGRGPDTIADVAEKVIDAVVNISTSQSADRWPVGATTRFNQRPKGSSHGIYCTG